MRKKGNPIKKSEELKTEPSRPNWRLIEETAARVDFDMDRIAKGDSLRLSAPNFKKDRIIYEYVISISRSIAQILQRELPNKQLSSTQISGNDVAINTLTSDGVQVVIRHTRGPKPGLSIMVLGEKDAQKTVARAIEGLKKKLEGG